MADLEDAILKEARRQGYQPTQNAMRQAAVDLAGGTMTGEGLIALPGKGSISPRDFVQSLRNHMPEAFGSLKDEKHPSKATGASSERMRSGVFANRHKPLPSDWNQVRARVSGLTAQCMAEVEKIRRRDQ
jgi:hypothetical protein